MKKIIGKITEVGSVYDDRPAWVGAVVGLKVSDATTLAKHLYEDVQIVIGRESPKASARGGADPMVRRLKIELDELTRVRMSFAELEARIELRESRLHELLTRLHQLREQLPAELAQIAALLTPPKWHHPPSSPEEVGREPCESERLIPGRCGGHIALKTGRVMWCAAGSGHVGMCCDDDGKTYWRGPA